MKLPRKQTSGSNLLRPPRSLPVLVVVSVFVSGLAMVAASQGIPFVEALPGQIVYTRASDNPSAFAIDLYVADANGENERQLTNTVDSEVYGSSVGEDQPRWSPDGQSVTFFTIDRDGLSSIWMIPQAGGTPTPLAQADGDQGGDPDWDADGQCVVYAGAHAGAGPSKLDLKRACRDGSRQTLLDTADVEERAPDVSPDGRWIVYQARRPPTSVHDRSDWSLRLMDADGQNDRLLYAPETGSATSPRWSPDGRRIAFVAGSALGIGRLSVLELETNETRALATMAGGQVAWSPDGRYLLFYNTAADGPRRLAWVAADPGEPMQTAQNLGLYLYDFSGPQLWRLRGPAGGAAAAQMSYRWGAAGDWWGPTPTPSAPPPATEAPTATEVPTEAATPTEEPTEPPTPSATATFAVTPSPTRVSPSPTSGSGTRLYLPVARRD